MRFDAVFSSPAFIEGYFFWLLGIALITALGLNLWQWSHDKKLAANLKNKMTSSQQLPDSPKVSILVAAWNEAAHIQNHIGSVLALRYPNFEYILCAGGDDATWQLASQYKHPDYTLLIQERGEGKQRALERCLEHATGKIIYLTDADCIINDQIFESVLFPIIQEGEQAVTGRFRPLAEQEQVPFVQMQWCVDHYARSRHPRHIEGLIGRNAAVTRSLLASVGGFQEPVNTGTDYFLAQKILAGGYPIRYVRSSQIETVYHTGFVEYLRQQTRWLRNILIHGRSFKADAMVRNALAQCAVGAMVIGIFLLSPFNHIFLILGAGLVSYGWLARLRYLAFGAQTLDLRVEPRAYFMAPIYFLADQLMLAYTLVTMVSKRRRLGW